MTLLPAGELDVASVGTLRACLDSIDRQCRNVDLDLAGLTFMDSTGVGVFVEAQQRFEPVRQLTLRNPTGSVARVIELTGLVQVIPVVHDGPQGRSP